MLKQRVISELMETYPELEKVFRETDRRRYLMIEAPSVSQAGVVDGLRSSPSLSDISTMKVYPNLSRSATFSFPRSSRGLLQHRRSVIPGPGFYESSVSQSKTLLSTARYSFGRAFRPLSNPDIAADHSAVKTDRGRLSPGPVYSKYTSLPIVHRLMTLYSC